MGVDVWDADAQQRALYEMAGLDPDEPARMVDLAHGLGLRVELVRAPCFPEDGMLVWIGGEPTIKVRAKASRERQKFACAHEIAEWALRREVDDRIEDACNAIAAALIAPRRAMVAATNAHGVEAWEQLALAFGMTQTGAALRSAEVHRFPLALVRPGLVRVRGMREWIWGPEERVRQLARAPGPGLRKIAITDEPKRVAIVADDGVDGAGQPAFGW